MDIQAEGIFEQIGSLVQRVGPGWTLIFFVSWFLALGISKIYVDRRRDKEAGLALQEKEKSIQRLAAENRGLRMRVMIKVEGFTLAEAKELIERNEFGTPKEAREALQQPNQTPTSKRSKS